jgi:hypothetical protein
MPLLQLPAEILFQIFTEVGASYFRSDVSRLTVCKLWSEFALLEFRQEQYATHKTVQHLLSSSYAETAVSLIKDHVQSLELCLNGFQYWEPCPESPRLMASHSHMEHILDIVSWNPHYDGASRGDLTRDLFYLVTIVRKARKLRSLHAYTFDKRNQEKEFLKCSEKLSRTTLCMLLSTSHLTSLELDLVGADVDWRCPGSKYFPLENPHLCTPIAALLPTLRRLRVRLPFICALILNVEEDIGSLRLSEVIVNLCLPDWSIEVGSKGDRGEEEHSTLCGTKPYNLFYFVPTDRFAALIRTWEEYAQTLAAKMAAPKKVWILTRVAEGSTLQAFDALSGTTIPLKAHSLDMPPWGDE